jgi:hypothetical protein
MSRKVDEARFLTLTAARICDFAALQFCAQGKSPLGISLLEHVGALTVIGGHEFEAQALRTTPEKVPLRSDDPLWIEASKVAGSIIEQILAALPTAQTPSKAGRLAPRSSKKGK